MTNAELEEHVLNAHAQAMGAQSVLIALLISLERHGTDRAIFKEAFDLAGDTYVAASTATTKSLKPMRRASFR